MVEQLRQQGHPMEQIAQKFKTGSDHEQNPYVSQNQKSDTKPDSQEPETLAPHSSQPDEGEGLTVQTFLANLQESKAPVQTRMAALAVQLDSWSEWQTRLLPNDFYLLLDQLLTTATDVFAKYQGIFVCRPPAGLVGYFIENIIQDYLSATIRCALELHLAASHVSKLWEAKHSQMDNLMLNMGMHAGVEPLAAIGVSGGHQIVPLGNVSEIAVLLADFARTGQIWVSKDVFNHLSGKTIEEIRFGIPKLDDRWEVFLPECFSKICDLLEINPGENARIKGIEQLAVTQLLEFKSGQG